MIEGWHDKDYIVLFEERSEGPAMAERYGIPALLPDFTLVGIVGWDDFILRDASGKLFTVPTAPSVSDYLKPLGNQIDSSKIKSDSRFTGRIKWYVHPIVFGGDPSLEKNVTWVSIDQHVELVKFWNNKYREMKIASASRRV